MGCPFGDASPLMMEEAVVVVDYSVGTGSAGRLIIHDSGTTVEFLIRCDDPATNVGTLRWSGVVNGVSVSGAVGWPSGGGTRRVGGPWTVSRTQSVSFTMQATGTMGLGGPATVKATISRPVPNAPTGVAITRVSDSQQTLNWLRQSTYTSVVIQRSTNDGAWQQVGVASGNAFTFTDKSTASNRRYRYRVAGVAASGQSAWSAPSAYVYTTPSAPTGIKAVRAGDNITVSASGLPPYYTGFDVRDGSTVIASNVSLPYTHVNPDPAVPHVYTVQAYISLNSLYSAWSSPSNTVQLISPPNAPTGLTPNGAVWASDEDAVFRWAHNAVDSSPQSAFELQYRVDGGVWTPVTGTTAEQVAVALPVGAVDWQVRTKGSHPDFSPWSAVASFEVIDRPGVAVVQPADAWDASILVVEWTWFQAQGRPQSGWQFELLDAANQVVESRNGSGSSGALQANTRLTEGTWTVRVRAASGEVWSLWATETFTVTFDPPAEPVLSGVWDESQGGVGLAVASEEFGVAVLDGGVWYAEVGD